VTSGAISSLIEVVVDIKSEPKKENPAKLPSILDPAQLVDWEKRAQAWGLPPELDLSRTTSEVERFFEKIAPVAALGATSMGILQAFANVDVNAEKMALLMSGNPFLEDLFQRVVASTGKREQVPSVEAAISLLGIQNSRNLIVANQILRCVRGTFPEWTKDGKLKVLSSDIVKYGLKTEELLVAARDPLSDVGFVAGVLFDIVGQLVWELADDKKKTQALLDSVFDHGLKTASYARVLTKGLPGFPYAKYVFAASLVHDLGKVTLAILDKRYLSFQEEITKRDLPRALRHHLELERFGLNHAYLGSLLLRAYPPLRVIASSVLLHHSPLLGRVDLQDVPSASVQGTRQLASILSLASNMASKPKRISEGTDPIVGIWRGAELRDFDFPNEVLVEASQVNG
jgi:HD-like signal output (HDOD) protein